MELNRVRLGKKLPVYLLDGQESSEMPTCKDCEHFCRSHDYHGFGTCSISLEYEEREFAIVKTDSCTCDMFSYG